MTGRLEICTVSGGRADYGLLLPVLRAIAKDAGFSLQLVLTGQHLVREAGHTAASARAEGFAVTEVDMQLAADDPVSISHAAGRGLAGVSDALARLEPDLLLVLGDRYEILCSAVAATLARIPIAHIAGGDLTEGAFDDAFRHAVTKLAHIHLVTNADAARRVRQLGEPADRVHVVGSPGLDLVRATKVPAREEFFAAVGLQPRAVNLIVTFHPATLAKSSLADLEEMLVALAELGDRCAVLFTGSNADPDGRRIDARLRGFVAGDASARRFTPSLGSELYFAALTHMDAMVGNSSSGLYEGPSFGIPAVNIGDRQKGRLRASSVIDCAAESRAIGAAIGAALARGRQPATNPYGDGHAAERIVAVLASIRDPRSLLIKRFMEREAA
jgi:UDP-hydrolysing UDP-N-acetyl-D-glucosamine 2-epimerase